MYTDSTSLYYRPWDSEEDSEFEQLDTIQWGMAAYSFNLTGLFRHKETGDLFLADDSGCSCPSPFEDTTVADATRVTRLQDFYDHCDIENRYYGTDPASVDEYNFMQGLLSDLLSKSVASE